MGYVDRKDAGINPKKRLILTAGHLKDYLKQIDVIFTALPNGGAQNISKYLLKNNILIDLAADFRLKKSSEYLKWYKKKHKAISKIDKSILVGKI